MVNELVEKDQNQWYSQFKRLTNQGKKDKLVVEEISHLTDNEQAEKIADHISSESQEYTHIKSTAIQVPDFEMTSIPHVSVSEIQEKLLNFKTKKSTVPGDMPAKFIKAAAEDVAVPLADVVNTSIRLGQWPNIYKIETITPAPKVQPP